MFKKLIPLLILIALLYSQLSLARKPPSIFSAQYLIFSKDKSQLIFLSSKNNPQKAEIIKISTNNGKTLKTVNIESISRLNPFSATPDGFKILANTQKGIAVIHNGTGKTLRTLPYPKPINKKGTSYRQSHDGVLLAIPSPRIINIIHTGSGKNLYSIDITKFLDKKINAPALRAMGFSPKRRYFAYITQSNRLKKSILTIYDIYKKTNVSQIDLASRFYDTGKIHFSKNGQNILINFFNKKGLSLINIKSQSIKDIKSNYFSFTSFTPDDQNIIMVQPYANSIKLHSIKTGKSKTIAIKLHSKDGYYGFNSISSNDRSLLALPLKTSHFDKINQFLLINARTGKLLRQLKNK